MDKREKDNIWDTFMLGAMPSSGSDILHLSEGISDDLGFSYLLFENEE